MFSVYVNKNVAFVILSVILCLERVCLCVKKLSVIIGM